MNFQCPVADGRHLQEIGSQVEMRLGSVRSSSLVSVSFVVLGCWMCDAVGQMLNVPQSSLW